MDILFYTLFVTHLTIVSTTLYLHRSISHRGVTFHPWVSHVMRFILWTTTSMRTADWVGIHRKHHRFTDVPGDPHSPHVFGILRVLFGGAQLYHKGITGGGLRAYQSGCPSDWMERHVYASRRWNRAGLGLMLLVNLLLWGWLGILVWGIQLLWIPLWAAGVVNGIGHWFGYKYRGQQPDDHSRNIVPWGIVIGGEELHANHHDKPASPKMSQRWYEFDIGWAYIKILEFFGLATIRS